MKWAGGVLATIVAAALIFMGSWIWNQQETVTKLSATVSNLAEVIRGNANAVERLQASDSTQQATLAAVQVQMTNIQTNQASAILTLAGRLDRMEQQQVWRERMQQQSRGR